MPEMARGGSATVLMSVSLVVIDDHTLFAQGISALLHGVGDITVAGIGADARAARRLVAEHDPDVVMIDVEMPNRSGIQATRDITSRWPDLPVLAMCPFADAWHLRQMFDNGARGYLCKDSSVEETRRAVHALAEGHTYIGENVRELNGHAPAPAASRSPHSILTRREIQIIGYIADCFRTTEIADHLSISAKTVDSHRKNIMDKLELDSVAQLTRYALRHGLSNSAEER